MPVSTLIDINLLPNFTDSNNEHVPKINWDSATDADLKSYLKLTDQKFSELELPMDALLCSDLNCQHVHHRNSIESFYNKIVCILCESSHHMYSKANASRNRPGWSDYVSDLYDYSREIRGKWLDLGRPRQGYIFKEF